MLITGASAGIGRATPCGWLAPVQSNPHGAAWINWKKPAEIEADGGRPLLYRRYRRPGGLRQGGLPRIEQDLGKVDILINNAGRSIRRSVDLAYDRFHDFERTMQLNYFGALRMILQVLPGMTEQKRGHIINISSMGVLNHPPRFSAYVASKSALEAFSICAASEFSDKNIHFTNINMPLVRTEMIAPTKIYQYAPALEVRRGGGPGGGGGDQQTQTRCHRNGQIPVGDGCLFPKFVEIANNATFRMFPDSGAAKGAAPERSYRKPPANRWRWRHL